MDGIFYFVLFLFYAIFRLLSVHIKLGSIGRGKISIANRVPANEFIVLVFIKG